MSDKHANFIQVSAGAAAADVIGLMTVVQESVAAATGITLRSEVRLVGFGADVSARFAGTAHVSGDVDSARSALAFRLGESS